MAAVIRQPTYAQIRETLLNGLVELRKKVEKGEKVVGGICGNMRDLVHHKFYSGREYSKSGESWLYAFHSMQNSRVDWHGFSGDYQYPVNADGFSGLSPEELYELFTAESNLWDQDTEYGQNRFDLLCWLIDDLPKKWENLGAD